MKKCQLCNRTIKLFSNSIICDRCTKQLIFDCKLRFDGVEKLNNQINGGFKKLDSYLSRYKIILENMKAIYENQKYIKKYLNINPPTYSEYFDNVMEEIKKIIINEKKKTIYPFQETGDIKYIKKIQKLKDEIIDLQFQYPMFYGLLNYNDLDKYLEGE